MVQIIVNLGQEEDRLLNIFKAEKGIRSKNDALNKMIIEYNKIHKKKKEDDIFQKKVYEALEEYEKTPNKKKLTKEEFLEELNKW